MKIKLLFLLLFFITSVSSFASKIDCTQLRKQRDTINFISNFADDFDDYRDYKIISLLLNQKIQQFCNA